MISTHIIGVSITQVRAEQEAYMAPRLARAADAKLVREIKLLRTYPVEAMLSEVRCPRQESLAALAAAYELPARLPD